MTQDRPVLGILLMLGFCVLAPLGDAIAKLLGERISIGQLVTVRFAVQMVILLPLVVVTGRRLRMAPRIFNLTILRTLLHIAGIAMMFLSLRYLPLADAVAIAFVMPFIMLILGHYILGEEVGRRRIFACAVGFIGTLFVIQPSFVDVGWPALLPLGVALDFAFFILVTRQVAKEVDPITLQAVSGLLATAILVPLLLLLGPLGTLGIALVLPATHDWSLLAALGILGTTAHLFMTWSLRFAPSATLAPMQYLEIPVAAVVGWIIFADFPNGLALIGISITIGAGLYILAREQHLSRSAQPEQPTGPDAA